MQGRITTAKPPAALAEDRLWRPEKAAWYLDVKTSWIYEAVRTGRVPRLRVGRHIRFTRHMLDDWLYGQVELLPDHTRRGRGYINLDLQASPSENNSKEADEATYQQMTPSAHNTRYPSAIRKSRPIVNTIGPRSRSIGPPTFRPVMQVTVVTCTFGPYCLLQSFAPKSL